MAQLEEGRVLGKVDFPHPDNMADVFEKSARCKVNRSSPLNLILKLLVEK